MVRGFVRFGIAVMVLFGCIGLTRPLHGAPARALRVCADPDNLPFSNRAREGFENRIAALFGESLNLRVEYTWWISRFIRRMLKHTLLAGKCDIMFGLPHDARFAREVRGIALTDVIYTTSYVLVVPRDAFDRYAHVRSIDDLPRDTRIGVWLRTPPQDALALLQYPNLVTYHPWYPEPVFADLAAGRIDLAVVWGPTAGYYQKFKYPDALIVRPIEGPDFVWPIAAVVRKDDRDLLHRVNAIIHTQRERIYRILEEYGIPYLDRRGDGVSIRSISQSNR